MPRGRPRKSNTEGTPEQVKKREYMRRYQSQIKGGIVQLEKEEADWLKDLERMRNEKMKLIDELEKANEQAKNILQEKVARPAKPAKTSKPAGGAVKKASAAPTPKPKSYTDDDWFSAYVRKDAGTQLSAVAKRAVAQRKK